jgi:AAA domain
VTLRVVTAAAFAAVDEPDAEALVGDAETNLLPAGGLALFYGTGGSGKTTLVIDLAFHLGHGRAWQGIEIPQACTVALVENEGPRGPFRRKIRAKIEAAGDPGERLLVLEEPWAELDFRQETARDALAELVVVKAIDVLAVGPVATLGMVGGGTIEEVRGFAALVEQMRRQIDRPLAIILVHHDNKAGSVSGAWEGVPDTLVHVQEQGHGHTRVFWEKARWASALHKTTWTLLWRDGEGFEREEKPEITEDTIADELLASVLELPGGSWSKLRPKVTGNDAEKAAVRDRLIATGTLINAANRDGHFNLWRADDPAAPRAEASTAPARLYVPPARDDAEQCRAAVPDVSKHGSWHGTADPADDEIERLLTVHDDIAAGHAT